MDTLVEFLEMGGRLAVEFTWGWNIFQKFLNKPMQKESDFGGR